MPNDRIKPPSKYLMHWHDCMLWLSERPSGEILVTTVVELSKPNPHRASKHPQTLESAQRTTMKKLQSMKHSIAEYPGWPPAVREMVRKGELSFKTRGLEIWAVRRMQPRPIEEVLRSAAEILARGD